MYAHKKMIDVRRTNWTLFSFFFLPGSIETHQTLGLTTVISGLQPYTNYSVRITSVNNAGESLEWISIFCKTLEEGIIYVKIISEENLKDKNKPWRKKEQKSYLIYSATIRKFSLVKFIMKYYIYFLESYWKCKLRRDYDNSFIPSG